MAPVRLITRNFVVGLSTREGMRGSWRDGDRRPRPEVEALGLDFDDHPAVEYVVGLAPAGPVQRRCRPPRRVDLEKLVVTVGVSRVDLHGEDRVRGGELGAFTGGG